MGHSQGTSSVEEQHPSSRDSLIHKSSSWAILKTPYPAPLLRGSLAISVFSGMPVPKSIVFEYDLHMSPSDMQLSMGQIENYNNLIVTAKKDMVLGSNAPLNGSLPPPSPPQPRSPILFHHEPAPLYPVIPSTITTLEDRAIASQHVDQKSTLIVGGRTIGLLALWFLR